MACVGVCVIRENTRQALKMFSVFCFNVSIVITGGFIHKLHPGEKPSRYSTKLCSSPIRLNVNAEKLHKVLLESLKI